MTTHSVVASNATRLRAAVHASPAAHGPTATKNLKQPCLVILSDPQADFCRIVGLMAAAAVKKPPGSSQVATLLSPLEKAATETAPIIHGETHQSACDGTASLSSSSFPRSPSRRSPGMAARTGTTPQRTGGETRLQSPAASSAIISSEANDSVPTTVTAVVLPGPRSSSPQQGQAVAAAAAAEAAAAAARLSQQSVGDGPHPYSPARAVKRRGGGKHRLNSSSTIDPTVVSCGSKATSATADFVARPSNSGTGSSSVGNSPGLLFSIAHDDLTPPAPRRSARQRRSTSAGNRRSSVTGDGSGAEGEVEYVVSSQGTVYHRSPEVPAASASGGDGDSAGGLIPAAREGCISASEGGSTTGTHETVHGGTKRPRRGSGDPDASRAGKRSRK